MVAVGLVASAFGGAVGGTLAGRFGTVRVLRCVIPGYALFDLGLPAAARKGAD